jgi:hypothetical protein
VPASQLRGFLLLAGAGAVLALVNLLGTAGAAIGLGLMLVGLVLSAPAAPRSGSDRVNWWRPLAAGTLLVAIGVPLELAWETPGGLLTGVGSALVVVAVALGLP